MKNSLTGLFCTCLLVIAGNLPGRAQEKKPDPQTAEQTAPATDATQPAAPSDPNQQTPPQQQTTPQTPPAGQTPPQTPPAGQTPAGQTPAGQTPPVEAGQQTQRGRVPEPPPPPPKVPDVRRPGESGYWIGIQGWFPREQPIFNRGDLASFSGSSRITMQGTPKFAEGLEIGAAVGLHNTLKLIYTDIRAAGNFTTPNDVVAWAQLYTAGTYVTTNYHLQHARLSYEYLTWPYPVGSRKFRLKTLWQVQFTTIGSTFDSPFKYYDSSGNLLLDSSGNPINLSASRSRRIVSPMFGLAPIYYPSRHFRFEANVSGFGFPHRYTILDADASINVRIAGHFEVRLGGRAFQFKTSTKAEYFLKGFFASAFVGVRWYSNSE